MGDGDAPTCIALSDIASLVVRIGHEDVPLVVDHVCVEVVWPTGVVSIVPRVHPTRVTLVCDINQSYGDLSGILPFSDIGVGSARVNQLVLHNHVFSAIVLEVLDIENLGVWIVVNSRHSGVRWVRNIDNVHFTPASDVGVCLAIGRVGDLNLGITRCCEFVE